MEKKRVFSKSLILLAITSIMLFAMSITSMAATETKYEYSADRFKQ